MARATNLELTDMIVSSIQGEVDLSDRLSIAEAGRHELYLADVDLSAGAATYDLFVRGKQGIQRKVKVTIEILAP